MIEIQNLGEYLELDEKGHLIRKAELGQIQLRWRPLIDEVVEFYRSQFQENLLSVYIRGSVAKGAAVDGISDLDSFCITSRPVDPSPEAVERFRKYVSERYAFTNGVELTGSSVDRLDQLHSPKKRNIWQELVKTQSVCVWGEDLSEKIAPFELKDMVAHSYWIEREITALPSKFQGDPTPKDSPEQVCTWIMKRIIRVGFEIVMLRENRWTRDLFPCFESFSRYYPEKKVLMQEALSLALNPSRDPEVTIQLVDRFRPWLFEEIGKHVPYDEGK